MDKRRTFEAEIMPHLDAAANLARWLARDSDLADDIVQEAALRAFRAFGKTQIDEPKAWLLQIVRNCHRTAIGKARARATVPLPEEDGSAPALESEEPSPEVRAHQAGEARRLGEAVAALPEDFREVLILREMEDLSYREIASIIEAPIGTVMSRLARARTLLREKWLGEDGMR